MNAFHSGRGSLVAAAVALLAACSGASVAGNGLPSTLRPASASSPIAHVVIVVQENRSFDNLFATFPGVNGATHGLEKTASGDKSIALKQHHLLEPHDVGHCYRSFTSAYDGGKMDGFNDEPLNVCPLHTNSGEPAGTYPYQYVNPSEIAPYWDMAEEYVLGDAMFQTQGSGSFTAHQDLIRGGTALAGCYGCSASLIDTPTGQPWGCDAHSTVRTDIITTALKWEYFKGPYPCTDAFPYPSSSYETIADLLDQQGVSWKYYVPCFVGSPKSSSCPSSERCTMNCSGADLNAFDVIYAVRNGPEWGTNVSMPETNFFKDIGNGALPAVSWVIPEDQNSDHPGDGKVDDGPSWVASIVNAVGESAYWKSTAIVILWDDWGGMYDNASPQFLRDDQGGLGFRVPLIVVSAYAKKGKSGGGYISHTQYEFGSILRFVEENWNLGSLSTTDARATSIADTLNYKQKPRKFAKIPSDHDAHYFITHRTPFSHGDPE